jgi:hypothetical protein
MTVRSLGHSLIALVAPSTLRDDIEGDLQERYRQTLRLAGAGRATAAFYRDVFSSLAPLVLLRCEDATRDVRLRAVVLGLAGCVAVIVGEAAASRAGIESLLAAHAIVATATLAACTFASTRPYAAALTMYAALVGSALVLTVLGPERRELGDADFYWRFARLAMTIGVCALLVRATRKRPA